MVAGKNVFENLGTTTYSLRWNQFNPCVTLDERVRYYSDRMLLENAKNSRLLKLSLIGSNKENARGPPLTHFPGRGAPGRSLYLNSILFPFLCLHPILKSMGRILDGCPLPLGPPSIMMLLNSTDSLFFRSLD